MTRIIDISMTDFPGMAVFPGDLEYDVNPHRQISAGDSANLSELRMGSHTGTHVDAPSHFGDGDENVDELPLDKLVGPVRVLDLTHVGESISAADLETAGAAGAPRILLKTGNSDLWRQPGFSTDYVALAADGAEYLAGLGVLLVGIDYLSIERFHPEEHKVHHTLLGARVVVLEGLDLSGVDPGDYELVCLPLKLKGVEGAPARAILIER